MEQWGSSPALGLAPCWDVPVDSIWIPSDSPVVKHLGWEPNHFPAGHFFAFFWWFFLIFP